MKKLMTIAGVLMIAGTSFAAAPGLSGLNLRLGLFYPTDGDTRDFTSDMWFTGGFDYKLKDMAMGNTSQMGYSIGLSVDWQESDEVRAIPVLVTLTSQSMNGIYWTGGAGVSFNHAPGYNKTKFSFMFGAGYEWKSGMNPISFEVRYFGNGDSELSGIGAYVGFRI
ncbi:MAG: hypothetical protein JNK63_07685 [Chthonomonas sp.]|nr:hypothetical protein [Chthonomonas sp.]